MDGGLWHCTGGSDQDQLQEKEMQKGKMVVWGGASWEICMQVKKQQLELDMEQQIGSKSGKEYVKTVYFHPAYLTYLQSTSCQMLDWMKYKLESNCQEKYQ